MVPIVNYKATYKCAPLHYFPLHRMSTFFITYDANVYLLVAWRARQRHIPCLDLYVYAPRRVAMPPTMQFGDDAPPASILRSDTHSARTFVCLAG